MKNFQLPLHKSEIPTPALLIDFDLFNQNLAEMARFFKDRSAKLRPHFKTHKCPIIAKKQVEAGAIGITCAKLGEAEVLVEAGITSILIANQIVDPLKIRRLAELAPETELIVAVDNPHNIAMLSAMAVEAGSLIYILVEVDVGLHRCGVQPGQAALDLARYIRTQPGLEFAGVLGYEGHTVFVLDAEERKKQADQAMLELTSTAQLIRQAGIPVRIVSSGGTGTYNFSGVYPGVTEIEAGSYVFMDTKYRAQNLPFQCALTLLSTVISVPSPEKAILDTGMKAITIENGLPEVVSPGGVHLEKLHEEHGIVSVDPALIQLKIGDRVEMIPSHICTTVNLHDHYYVMEGEWVKEIWPISARGKFQ
jgi:D-serine deaminase-like pyridoxal phosphate-dependent protein